MTAAGTRGPALRVRGLSKRYGGTPALEGVDLELQPGELRGLLGPNGAGKTTLLRALFGLIRPDAGVVELLGRPVRGGGVAPIAGVAGFVEEPAFYPYLSGRANLELLRQLDDGGGGSTEEALERAELSAHATERVGGYSTGMRQRLGIAAALLRQPRLLLLDEPTSGLDPAGIRAVSSLLRELRAQGVAVLLSSHLIGELEAVCDAYTIIHHGRVVWDGSREQLEREALGAQYSLSSTDDASALELADGFRGVEAEPAPGRGGIRLTARADALDAYAIALGARGVGVRRLELLVGPLESLFFALTGPAPEESAAPARAAIRSAP